MATQPESNSTARLITAKRAAHELGVPYSSLRDAVHRGELPVVRIGRNDRHKAWYFDRADLLAWLELCRNCPTSTAAAK